MTGNHKTPVVRAIRLLQQCQCGEKMLNVGNVNGLNRGIMIRVKTIQVNIGAIWSE